MPSQKPTVRPQSHARRRGYRDTTRHASAAQRAAEGAQSHARKTTERPTRSSTAARMGLFSFTFRFVSVKVSRGELCRADFQPSESPFCGFSENEKVYFLSRFPRRHRVEAHQPPRNQDNAVAPLPGLLLHREGCSA